MIVAGVGFRSGASAESLLDAYARAGGGADALATIADKAGADGFLAFAVRVKLPVTKVNPQSLSEQNTATCSDHSINARDTGSVAEAAALAAAGPGARLIAPRVVSGDRMATCALAEGKDP